MTLNKITSTFKQILNSILGFLKYFSRREVVTGDDVMFIRFAKLRQPKLKYDIRKKIFTFSIQTKDDLFKYLYIFLMLFLAFYLPWRCVDVGISDMELQHHQYAAAYYNYHANNDPGLLSMKYFTFHGQFTDNLCYAASQWFHIDDPFALRHTVSSAFGWLTILTLGLFLVRLFSWRAAFFGALFLFLSPRFTGNALSNLTDTSFAFAITFSLYQIYIFCHELPVIKWKRLLFIVIGIAFANSIHIGGYFMVACLFVFAWTYFFTNNSFHKIKSQSYWAQFLFLTIVLLCVSVAIYLLDLIYMPLELQLPYIRPFKAIPYMLFDPHPTQQLFDNQMIWSNNTPPNYFIRFLFITIPFVVLIGFFLFWGFIRTIIKNIRPFNLFILLFSLVVPFLYIYKQGVNMYEDFAVYLFIYPMFVLLATSGYEGILRRVDDRYTNVVIVAVMFLLSLMPLRHIFFNHPLEDVYFNEISGSIQNAYGKYDLDYNFHYNKKVCEWLLQDIQNKQLRNYKDLDKVVIGTNGNKACQLFFEKDSAYIKLEFFPYDERDQHEWNYYINFAHSNSSEMIKSALWPPQESYKIFTLEQKPLVAIIHNPLDTLVNDSLAVETVDLH